MRSSPNAAAMRWSWLWISCGWLVGAEDLADLVAATWRGPGGTMWHQCSGGPGFGGGLAAGLWPWPVGPVTPVPAQTSPKCQATGRPATSTFASAISCSGPIRSGPISAVTNASGFPGSPCFKINIAGTDRALAATADAEVETVPAFTGAPEQLWRIDQFTDGTYRIMPKVVPNST